MILMREGNVSHGMMRWTSELTTKSRSSTDIMYVFSHFTRINNRIDSSNSDRSTLAHDEEIFSSESSGEGNELRDSAEE